MTKEGAQNKLCSDAPVLATTDGLAKTTYALVVNVYLWVAENPPCRKNEGYFDFKGL
jgi:hypothetical protein